jgi:hypothetical protein
MRLDPVFLMLSRRGGRAGCDEHQVEHCPALNASGDLRLGWVWTKQGDRRFPIREEVSLTSISNF